MVTLYIVLVVTGTVLKLAMTFYELASLSYYLAAISFKVAEGRCWKSASNNGL